MAVIYPRTPIQANILAKQLQDLAGVAPSTDAKLMAWAEADDKNEVQLRLIVGFNAFIGKTCQIHVAMTEGFHFTPKEMLREVFENAFNRFKVEKLIGIVNSKNEKAMNYDFRLGFVEEFRFPGMHDDGGDIVVLTMTRDQCRYLQKVEAA